MPMSPLLKLEIQGNPEIGLHLVVNTLTVAALMPRTKQKRRKPEPRAEHRDPREQDLMAADKVREEELENVVDWEPSADQAPN